MAASQKDQKAKKGEIFFEISEEYIMDNYIVAGLPVGLVGLENRLVDVLNGLVDHLDLVANGLRVCNQCRKLLNEFYRN